MSTQNIEDLNKQIDVILERVKELNQSADDIWLLITSFCIIFMQTGFLLLEAGSVRAKNARSIMIKNVCDACFGGIAWYFIGYAVYAGTPCVNETSQFVGWIQSYAFAMTTSTIVSGGIASRMKFEPYMLYSMIMCAWIYPIVAKWSWQSDGWLYLRGYKDFAGSGPVHVIGGVSALIGSIALGPRIGRFSDKDGRDRGIKRHSDALVVLGALILWFGWFSFNAGSGGGTSKTQMELSQRAAANTLISSATGGIGSYVICLVFIKHHDIGIIVNGVLGALVAITGPCAYVDTWVSILIGFLSPFITYFGSKMIIRFHVDDPLDASPVHCFNGIFGMFVTGIFDTNEGLLLTGNTKLMEIQIIGILVMFFWSLIHGFFFFFVIGKFLSLRVNKDDELLGLDFKYCDGYAYDYLDADTIAESAEIKEAERRIKEAAAARPKS